MFQTTNQLTLPNPSFKPNQTNLSFYLSIRLVVCLSIFPHKARVGTVEASWQEAPTRFPQNQKAALQRPSGQ